MFVPLLKIRWEPNLLRSSHPLHMVCCLGTYMWIRTNEGGEHKNNRIKDETIQASQTYFKEIWLPSWNKASVAFLVPHDTPTWSLTGFFHKPTLRSKVKFTLQAPFELFCSETAFIRQPKRPSLLKSFFVFLFGNIWLYIMKYNFNMWVEFLSALFSPRQTLIQAPRND